MVYRILSLDGGGMRGILSAKLLSLIEREINILTGQTLQEYFQFVAGTSTGSILAAGVAIGKTGEQLVQLYREQGRRIFPYWGGKGYFFPQRIPLIIQSGLSAPKFSHAGLQKVLQEALGSATLAEIHQNSKAPKLLIPAYDTFSRTPIFFKTWRNQEWYKDIEIWEACVCSASAPTFFPAYPLNYRGITYSMVDGGVGANNPAACAIASAINLGNKLEDICILSIGTGEATKGYPYEETRHWGLTQWGLRIVDILMDAPLDIDEYISRKIILQNEEDSDRYLRLQPELSNEYLDRVLDAELRGKLAEKIKGKKPRVIEDIDDASSFNIEVLSALAEGYFHNATVSIRNKEGRKRLVSIKTQIKNFLETNA
ncbi:MULTISPECIES: patatin-like phospholipase family protein [Spirulina sp. CCY15215]|uniref:patatin-like phospholipase family protein n=1 Tax=Spirulina sp. CCY15215 TaxID=2767591 RepID=UPI0019522A2B|nr:patatin-like phospholipase family protein [Spirulina major]